MTKQEKIQEAYGEHWATCKENIDENGWLNMTPYKHKHPITKENKFDVSKEFNIRPKSLYGIEDNHGWTKIESEDDLPKESGEYYVMDKINGVASTIFSIHDEVDRMFWINQISHYQPIVYPKRPLY